MNNLYIKITKMFITFFALGIIIKINVFALSDDFVFAINTIGMPRYNVLKEEINEEIYNTYQVFVYSSPTKIPASKGQIFCQSKFGYWTKNGGSYKGYGIKGEYLLLGNSYNGDVIHNHFYPITEIPRTTPEKWIYSYNSGANQSWRDKTKYKYLEQLNFMKNTKLMFNDVLDKINVNNPKYMKEYNITANKIGLNKAKLDTSSTWKTFGIVHALRKVNGKYFNVIFYTPKMAADADLKNNIDVKDKIVLKSDEDAIYIPISYKSQVINLKGYASEKHIKEIKSDLYIDNKLVDTSNGSKIASVGNTYMLAITRDEFPPEINHKITIIQDSYMHTEFVVDGLIRRRETKELQIFVEKKAPKQIENNNLKNLSKQNTWVVSPFAQTNISNIKQGICGVTEASKYIAAKINIEEGEKLDKVFVDDTEVLNEIICASRKDAIVIKIKIPYNTKPTIYGINSLRDEYNNFFEIDSKKFYSRKAEPHTLKIVVKKKERAKEYEAMFDTIDNVYSNINYSLENLVINKDDIKIKKDIEEWYNEQ